MAGKSTQFKCKLKHLFSTVISILPLKYEINIFIDDNDKIVVLLFWYDWLITQSSMAVGFSSEEGTRKGIKGDLIPDYTPNDNVVVLTFWYFGILAASSPNDRIYSQSLSDGPPQENQRTHKSNFELLHSYSEKKWIYPNV